MKELIKNTCGVLASGIFPGKRHALANEELVPGCVLDTYISGNLIRRAAIEGNEKSLRNQLSRYWQGYAGDLFHKSYADRFEDWFLGQHYEVVETVKQELESSGGDFRHMVEIGCGAGQVLEHLSQTLVGIERFTGLDINPRIIEKNRETYQSTDLQFEKGDAVEWIGNHAEPGTVLMSYGGVMEYLPANELTVVFEKLKEKSPALIALVEPLYDDFDLENETNSRTSGVEHSWSHNHRHLLEKAGFEVEFQKEVNTDIRWIMIVARG